MSQLLWVAVPNGLVAPKKEGEAPSQASIRVLVVPQLTGANISEDGLQDWPTVLAGASFRLLTKTSLGVGVAKDPPTYVQRARSEVWTGFFGGDAGLVIPYTRKAWPAPSGAGAVDVAEALKVRETYDDARRVNATYLNVHQSAANEKSDTDAVIRSELAGWKDFDPTPPPAPTDAPTLGTPDFHATVTRLREHPTVLLDLGLIFELLVNVTDLAVGDPDAGRQLSIRCDDPPTLTALVSSPWTRYDLHLTPTITGFWPAPASASSGISKGRLDLSKSTSITSPKPPTDPAPWAISTFEIDGVVGNLRQTARDLAANKETETGNTGTGAANNGTDANEGAPAMPRMRSAGLGLLRLDRAADLADRVRLAQSRAEEAVGESVLSAEDLVLGYRVDVRRRSDHSWRSVCERDAKYEINGLPIGQPEPGADRVREEGHVKGFAAVKDAEGRLHTDQVVLRWGGWSLAVPMPNLRGDARQTLNTDLPLPYNFSLDFDVPTEPERRLPLLRFSDQYRMRIRIADIAGGGPTLDNATGSEKDSDEVFYRRHEPVSPPQLRDTGPFGPGAAVDRMVIRSDRSTPVPGYPMDDGKRIMDRPIASLQIVEQHKMLDEMSNEDSFELAARAMSDDAPGGGLADPAVEGIQAVALPETGSLDREITADVAWPKWPKAQPKTIELLPHPTQPQPVTLIWWDTSTLRVTLGEAEQATIELSSKIDGDKLDHLAFRSYLNDDPALERTLKGRNPVVTPPLRLRVVHAVRTPLAEPRWDAVDVDRQADTTHVLLQPTFTAASSGYGLNTDSTGRLQVTAAWTEVEDAGEVATLEERAMTAVVHSQPIDRGDNLPPVRIRHEFGDTRYRAVTYTVQATSRFRHYFERDEPEEAFQSTHTHKPLDVLSTVRPLPPAVLAVVPAFTWQRTMPTPDRIEHVRAGQRLRVEVGRPWFQTGAGEQLVVVLARTDTDAAAAADWVTRMGRDPLFATPDTQPPPAPAWFPNANDAQEVTLPESGTPVTIIPVDMAPAGDRWYGDIALTVPTNAESYNPFIRLALARYQRHSLDGLELSPVVTNDTVPLLPDRRVTLTRTGTQVTITVDGISPQPLNRLEAILESCPPGITPETLDVTVDDPTIESQLETWRPVERAERNPDGLIPPLTLITTPGRLRIRLHETENLPGIDSEAPLDLTRRPVFVDTIVLPKGWHPT